MEFVSLVLCLSCSCTTGSISCVFLLCVFFHRLGEGKLAFAISMSRGLEKHYSLPLGDYQNSTLLVPSPLSPPYISHHIHHPHARAYPPKRRTSPGAPCSVCLVFFPATVSPCIFPSCFFCVFAPGRQIQKKEETANVAARRGRGRGLTNGERANIETPTARKAARKIHLVG